MLSQLEKALLVDFAVVSTLLAVGRFSFHSNMFSNETIESARSSVVRRKCIAWAKKNGKVAQ
jgi:cell division protein FtsL